MNVFDLNKFIGGWFIGNFEPSLFQTSDFEVAIKKYKAGDKEQSHTHKIATEYTAIASGSVKMNGVTYNENSIIQINPGEYTDFIAVTDCITVVVKIPSVKNDKFIK